MEIGSRGPIDSIRGPGHVGGKKGTAVTAGMTKGVGATQDSIAFAPDNEYSSRQVRNSNPDDVKKREEDPESIMIIGKQIELHTRVPIDIHLNHGAKY
ncbi:MAG: hypothetical protein ACI9S8_002370 [Chlamydiales bacterium]|jgi:hypothetical protein